MANRLFPTLTASRLHLTTYLLGIALFSISFLVFLNSSISFVVTDVIGEKENMGDIVGTLGFADELLALVACPVWGLLSDRVGVRLVAVAGYVVVGVALIWIVKSGNVYPELLLGRLVFSVGGAACSTMVTAVLPAMTARRGESMDGEEHTGGETSHERGNRANGHAARLIDEERRNSIGHGATPSVSSELTITPTLYTSRSRTQLRDRERGNDEEQGGQAPAAPEDHGVGTSQLAGFVGMFTGAGALVALAIFLPLPAYFQDEGSSPAQAVQSSFYIVAAIAFCVAIFIFIGLRNLPGEEDKNFSSLFSRPYDESTRMDGEGNLHTTLTPAPSYLLLLKEALLLGFTDKNIGLGYVGGFVARASSVGISLFIPHFVNAYFKRNNLCPIDGGTTLPELKKNCQDAYKLASALSGIAETAALLCAPLFGVLGAKVARGKSEWPLLAAGVIGVGGYVAFGMLKKPDPFHGEGGQWAILAVILIGVSQIGSIVCSLGLLGRGTNAEGARAKSNSKDGSRANALGSTTLRQESLGPAEGAEVAPLLPTVPNEDSGIDVDDDGEMRMGDKRRDRSHLKGSIAGMYSFAGGAGILILTKLGGALSDSWTPGAPFFILAIFNAVLVVAVVGVGAGGAVVKRSREKSSEHAD